MRILFVEDLRIPEEGSSAQGQSGPKARPEGVADGQSVDIPIPLLNVMREGVTQEDSSSTRMEKCAQASSRAYRENRMPQ